MAECAGPHVWECNQHTPDCDDGSGGRCQPMIQNHEEGQCVPSPFLPMCPMSTSPAPPASWPALLPPSSSPDCPLTAHHSSRKLLGTTDATASVLNLSHKPPRTQYYRRTLCGIPAPQPQQCLLCGLCFLRYWWTFPCSADTQPHLLGQAGPATNTYSLQLSSCLLSQNLWS